MPGVGLERRPDYSGLLRNLSVSYVTRFARSYFPTRENSRFPDPFPVRINKSIIFYFSYFMLIVKFSAAGQGFEPQFPRPERGVLPLDDPALK